MIERPIRSLREKDSFVLEPFPIPPEIWPWEFVNEHAFTMWTECRGVAPEVAEHEASVAYLANKTAIELGLPVVNIYSVTNAALLHDEGKTRKDILDLTRAPRKLEPFELTIIRDHPWIGVERVQERASQLLLDGYPLFDVLTLLSFTPGIAYHHERWVGGGYPDDLMFTETPLSARIISAADWYHASRTHRPDTPAMSVREAKRNLNHQVARGQLDPRVVTALATVIDKLLLDPDERLYA
jgi:HD-GYP domain-containing protein (c-di-GMP phosphodiesterase class II)